MKSTLRLLVFGLLSLGLVRCNESTPKKESAAAPPSKKRPAKIQRKVPAKLSYHLESGKKWVKSTDTAAHSTAQHLVETANRADAAHLAAMDSIIVPDDLNGGTENYLPFPFDVKELTDVSKILLFSYPTQSFAAYEYGQLTFAGPTNMGRKKDPTPEGLYYTNWKAEQTTSTFNDEWDLKWNFNIENNEGIGFHQYAMPGYPASHSCLRLLEADAKYLYDWAEEWKLVGTDSIKAYGTPVLVFGSYNFGGPKPWRQLLRDPHALDMKEADIASLVKPHLADIMKKQEQREKMAGTKSEKK